MICHNIIMRGNLMISRNLLASILTACLLAIGLGAFTPAANAASAGQSLLNSGENVSSNVIEVRRRGHTPRMYLPRGPGSVYYDYPYYYSRGYYPTHIGPRYMYYPPYSYPYAGRYYQVEHDDGDYGDDEDAAPYSAKERCARRFKSFEWDTGRYTTYGGRSKLCPYLR
jgi:hypothetical protein